MRHGAAPQAREYGELGILNAPSRVTGQIATGIGATQKSHVDGRVNAATYDTTAAVRV